MILLKASAKLLPLQDKKLQEIPVTGSLVFGLIVLTANSLLLTQAKANKHIF